MFNYFDSKASQFIITELIVNKTSISNVIIPPLSLSYTDL